MTAFPKLDYEVDILTTGNFRIQGSINVLGRSIAAYLQGPEPDLILYKCIIDQDQTANTIMISKHQVVTVLTGEQSPVEERIGNWRRLSLIMSYGKIITGDINITGYDRVSDYIQNFKDHFYELHSVDMGDKICDRLYVSRLATVWKEPVK